MAASGGWIPTCPAAYPSRESHRSPHFAAIQIRVLTVMTSSSLPLDQSQQGAHVGFARDTATVSKLAETLVAFANAGGGTLLVGLDPRSGKSTGLQGRAAIFDLAITQAMYYLRGIFKGEDHPYEKTPEKKLNPLQQVTYFGLLNILLPLIGLTGILMWGAQRWPAMTDRIGGLIYLAPIHTMIAWLFASFVVLHVYLTTTGYKPLTGIQAMMMGWEQIEVPDGSEVDLGNSGAEPLMEVEQPQMEVMNSSISVESTDQVESGLDPKPATSDESEEQEELEE